MARQDIDIGVEGNDGTGDSIRESFRKSNQNFRELYAVFGEGGRIEFTALGDTPDTLIPNSLPFVNSEGTFIDLRELASNSAQDAAQADTILFDTSVDGKLILTSGFQRVSDDLDPTLGGPLDAAGRPIANVSINEQSVIDFNNVHGQSINIDNLVITKGYADQRYISGNVPVRIPSEPSTTNQYTLVIEDYVAGNGNVLITNHGFTRQLNGTPFVFKARYNSPVGLTDGETYFLRYATDDQLSVFENREDAQLIDDTQANQAKLLLTGTIESDDRNTFTDAAFDPSIEGNFLSNVAVPRESVVRRQGDSMQGRLDLNDHPGDLSGFGLVNGDDDLQAASKLYVDNSAYSSPENLFVSTFGDDSMVGVPRGREGTALAYAFRSVNAAAQRAAEIIETSPAEPGPYFQTVTNNNGEQDAVVIDADIVAPENEQARKLIELNTRYTVEEALGYLDFEFPDFDFQKDEFRAAYTKILESIAYDINRGLNANFLTRAAAENYFNSIAGRVAISRQLTENKAGIEFLRESTSNVLQNRLFQEKTVSSIVSPGETEVTNAQARVTTSNNHNFVDGSQVFFKDMGGMIEIEGLTAYVRVIDPTTFELYEDDNLETLWNISSFTDYTTGGKVGLVFQDRIAEFETVKETQAFEPAEAQEAARIAIADKFDLVLNIIENGVGAGADTIFGNNYKIVLDNANRTFVDQANPQNTDTLPGKIMVGKISGAQGRIVKVVNNDPTENNNDSFELVQLNERDFITGEAVEYGNFVKKKQVTIFVESGIYEEDLPIKLANNVSVKGDEFRRVIIRPKSRTSQSVWASTYLFRDLEFDDIPLLEKNHSTVTRLNSTAVTVDDVSWISTGLPVKFIGKNIIGSEIDSQTEYYITDFDESTLEISVTDTEGGSPINFTSASGEMYVVSSRVSAFLNQTDDVQGYFGRHYLTDPYAEKNVGIIPQNSGGFDLAAQILAANKIFIIQEVLSFINSQVDNASSTGNTGSIWFQYIFDAETIERTIGDTVNSLIADLTRGGTEFILETQGKFAQQTKQQDQDQTDLALAEVSTLAAQLLNAVDPVQTGDRRPDTTLGIAEAGTVSLVGGLVNLVRFAFASDYNPPKQNDDDGVDVFMMGDATILRNVTVQGQGGFMIVLDPEGQILTKSPYIQTGSSFSKSDNEKRFRGGMYVDAFVGNIPLEITNVITEPGESGSFELEVQSPVGQGLRIRPPQLPAPFYLDAVRYQVNAIGNYDSGQGTATLFLDRGSNPDSSGVGQGYQGPANQPIFLQTAGNRSMLGNDFTQINDLGYGLVTNNGAFSEMVSMFTYYCQAAYYAKNGSEIRSLNGSNGYGNFGLVAEGADPNEIPDQVTLKDPMMQPARAYTTPDTPNVAEETIIYVYDLEFIPTVESIITIDHGESVGVLDYRISNVENWSNRDGEGADGDSPEDIVATGGVVSNRVYRLSLFADTAISDNFFGTLQADVADDTFISYRNNRSLVFNGVANVEGLSVRPSTAINFEESFETTYRSLAFAEQNSINQDLADNTILASVELDFDFVQLEVDIEALSQGFGLDAGDTKIPVLALPTQERIERLLRDINGNQPGDIGYTGGGMIFSYAGKTHRVIGYETDSSVPYIEIEDFGTDITQSGISGLAEGIPNTYPRTFAAGLIAGSEAEITQAISLLRATGHDFTQIGTGSYNDSNYPNVILGEPENDEAGSYTDSPTATKSQVWERLKGRVFFVSTDQDGFFRVGKFFSVDQSTGDIEFSGELGLTGANALGFKRGVTVNEFSADDSFSDNSERAVPTERAAKGYIDRALGYNLSANSQIKASPEGNRIGPGFLPLNGFSALEGDIDLGGNQITNLALPASDGSAAANKNYVDGIIQAFDSLADIRNLEINSIAKDDIIVATGKKKIFITPVTGGSFAVGDKIGTAGGFKEGTIVDIESRVDEIEGNIQIITYTLLTANDFTIEDAVFDRPGETATAEVLDGPFDEIAHAKENASSVINVTVDRLESEVTYNFQIEDGSLVNADVSSTAGISQSKLSMQKADTFAEDDAVTGWDGTADKNQSDLGLAVFSSNNFDSKEGYIRIKSGGISYSEIQDIPEDTVLGRNSDGTGDLSAVAFSTVIDEGGGLEDSDFTNTVVSTDAGFPGNALVELESGVYGTTEISEDVGPNTIARRRDNGYLDAQGYRIDGSPFVERSSTTLQFKTPGGAEIFSAAGNVTESLVTSFPGNIDIGNTALTTQSNFQAGSGFANEGWMAVDWMYTSFIEAAGERDGNSTGISIGGLSGTQVPTTGFANAGPNVIDFITNGGEKFVIRDTNTQVLNDFIVGSNQNDSISFNARLGSNLQPDGNSTRSLGSNSLRFNTVFADIFNGVATEAKYADLAEKYSADAAYEPGTVLVFGGEQELTTTNKKADHRAAGIVSENPAYLMNSDHTSEYSTSLALQGRVKCKVLGKVQKGDLLVTSAIPGYAVVNNSATVGTIIGKALENKETDIKDIIEVVVGKV